VLDRVKQLEEESLGRVTVRKEDVRELANAITRDVHDFEHAFEPAPPSEKKLWIRRFVLGIQVERDKNRALCYIMKIPTVSHPTMTALIPSESSINIVAEIRLCLRCGGRGGPFDRLR
jgi:hypothetical protein